MHPIEASASDPLVFGAELSIWSAILCDFPAAGCIVGPAGVDVLSLSQIPPYSPPSAAFGPKAPLAAQPQRSPQDMFHTAVLGLLGGIGSGKSTVAALLSEQGAIVLDADAIAHEVLTDPSIITEVTAAFGKDVLSTWKIFRA